MIIARTLSSAAGVRHGFLTRQGGVSKGVYESLNCSFSSGDDPSQIAENRRRAVERLGLPGGVELVTVSQSHSAIAVTVKTPWKPEDSPKADALVTNQPGLALGVLSADCAPVLLADAKAGVIGAAHAGWKGALDGVLEATLDAMRCLGGRRRQTVAAIGPCIHQASYEVGPTFYSAFLIGDSANMRFFTPSNRPGHHFFNLPGYAASRLRSQGLADVEILPHDTFSEEDHFFSYRRATLEQSADYGRSISTADYGRSISTADYGRSISIIALKNRL